MAAQARACGWTFPYLQDQEQSVARAFRAACTPDPFLFDAAHRLAYRGQLDDSRPGQRGPLRWPGSARGPGRRAGGAAGAGPAAAGDRLQHQVASRRRASLVRRLNPARGTGGDRIRRLNVAAMHVPPFSLSEQLQQLGDALDHAVLEVLRSGQYIGGTTISGFESAFAAACDVPHAIGCNSGTDALVLALRALGIGPGDEVITSSFSFFATAEAISTVGATPVFVDVDPDTYLIDPERIEAAITPATRALMPVHLFGRPVDMERIGAIAAAHGLRGDRGLRPGQRRQLGRHGRWAAGATPGGFSFFPTKNLGGGRRRRHGDLPRSRSLAQRIRELAVHGMPRRYLHTELGYNSRLDALQAAVLTVKLPHLAGWVERRRAIAERYQRELAGLPSLVPAAPGPEGHSWNQFVVRVPHCPRLPAAPARDAAPPPPTAPATGSPKPAAATGSSSSSRRRG